MQESKILTGKKLSKFCKELNKEEPFKILLKINGNKAEYYNPIDDTLYKLDINVATKYI